MLRMICEKTLRDGINNHTVRDMTCVENIEEFIRQQILRWLGIVKKVDDKRAPVKAKNLVVDGSKKSRPKKRWEEVKEKGILAIGLKANAQDFSVWRLDGKNWLNHCSQKKQNVFWRMNIFVNTPGTNGW